MEEPIPAASHCTIFMHKYRHASIMPKSAFFSENTFTGPCSFITMILKPGITAPSRISACRYLRMNTVSLHSHMQLILPKKFLIPQEVSCSQGRSQIEYHCSMSGESSDDLKRCPITSIAAECCCLGPNHTSCPAPEVQKSSILPAVLNNANTFFITIEVLVTKQSAVLMGN